jgi:hypothetical protein
MRQKLIGILICMLLIATVLPVTGTLYNMNTTVDKGTLSHVLEGGWHYLPSYGNYAPNGTPDFYQKQDT